MSRDWDVYCIDCDKEHGFDNAIAANPHLLAVVIARDRHRVVGLHSGQEMPSTVMDLKGDIGSDDGVSDEILPDSEHPRVESPQPLSIPRRYQKYASMDASDLLQLPLEFLRELAGRAFKIVGASKVRGGRTELVRLIEEVRGR